MDDIYRMMDRVMHPVAVVSVEKRATSEYGTLYRIWYEHGTPRRDAETLAAEVGGAVVEVQEARRITRLRGVRWHGPNRKDIRSRSIGRTNRA